MIEGEGRPVGGTDLERGRDRPSIADVQQQSGQHSSGHTPPLVSRVDGDVHDVGLIGHQHGSGGDGVLEQLETRVVGESDRHDPRADDGDRPGLARLWLDGRDDRLRAVVLTGAGDRAFCTGGDP